MSGRRGGRPQTVVTGEGPRVHLVDGTYELFRHYFAVPSHRTADGAEVGALRGVLNSLVALLGEGATHIGVATDHVIESFRNDLWPGYKTGAGIAPDLLAQFTPLEDALRELGVVVWAMVEHEADDALAAAARQASAYAREVLICTPDKDLAQCVVDGRVVQYDRRKRVALDDAGVLAKYGVPPASIPDYLALVGDAADGYPGLPGWGAKSAAAILRAYGHIEAIPEMASAWSVELRGAHVLAATLRDRRAEALLFKDLATLRVDIDVDGSEERLRWRGPRAGFRVLAGRLGSPALADRADALAASRAGA